MFTYSACNLNRAIRKIEILTNITTSLNRLCCFIICLGRVYKLAPSPLVPTLFASLRGFLHSRTTLLSQLIKCIIHLIGFIVNSFVLYFYVTQNLQLTFESISQLIKHSIAPNGFIVNLCCCKNTTR